MILPQSYIRRRCLPLTRKYNTKRLIWQEKFAAFSLFWPLPNGEEIEYTHDEGMDWVEEEQCCREYVIIAYTSIRMPSHIYPRAISYSLPLRRHLWHAIRASTPLNRVRFTLSHKRPLEKYHRLLLGISSTVYSVYICGDTSISFLRRVHNSP